MQFLLKVACALIFGAGVAKTEVYRILSSGYEDTFQWFDVDSDDSTITAVQGYEPQIVDEALCWVEYDEETRNLFAVHWVGNYANGDVAFSDTGAVSRWKLLDDGLTFERQEARSSFGLYSVHLALSKLDGMAVSSNYWGASVAAYALEGPDLELSEAPFFVEQFKDAGSGVVIDRQNQSHPHGAWFYGSGLGGQGRFLLVADLGADRLYVYQVGPSAENPSLLRLPLDVDVGPGRGPRHVLIDEDGGLAYVLCEVKPYVKVYSVDFATGALLELAEVEYELDGADFSKDQRGAELALHPNLPILYITHRGQFEAIVSFDILGEEEGYLRQRQVYELDLKEHRYLFVTPDGRSLVTSSQYNDTIKVFSVDGDGELELSDQTASENQPGMLPTINFS